MFLASINVLVLHLLDWSTLNDIINPHYKLLLCMKNVFELIIT